MYEKKFSKLFIIDGSYLIHRQLHVPEMYELRAKNSGQRTGGIFGFLNSLNHEIKTIDAQIVVTWDSGLSPRRVAVYNDYKRNKDRTIDRILHKCSTEEEAQQKLKELENLTPGSIEEMQKSIHDMMQAQNREKWLEASKTDNEYPLEYHRQRNLLIEILNNLGVPSLKYNNWEGDDLITLLTRMSYESVVMTDDKDMIQLVAPNVSIRRPMHKDTLTYDEYMKEEGFDSIREFTILKAISGDGSDNIPSVTSDCERKYSLAGGGARGKYVAKLICSSGENPEVYLKELVNTGKNYYKGFVENHDNFIRNMKLVDLSLVEDDEDIVKAMVSEIQSKAGKCNLMNAMSLIGAQEITTFDVNGFIPKINLLSATLEYK